MRRHARQHRMAKFMGAYGEFRGQGQNIDPKVFRVRMFWQKGPPTMPDEAHCMFAHRVIGDDWQGKVMPVVVDNEPGG